MSPRCRRRAPFGLDCGSMSQMRDRSMRDAACQMGRASSDTGRAARYWLQFAPGMARRFQANPSFLLAIVIMHDFRRAPLFAGLIDEQLGNTELRSHWGHLQGSGLALACYTIRSSDEVSNRCSSNRRLGSCPARFAACLATYRASKSSRNSRRRFESCPLRCTNVVKTTTFLLQRADCCCPVAYPVGRLQALAIALPAYPLWRTSMASSPTLSTCTWRWGSCEDATDGGSQPSRVAPGYRLEAWPFSFPRCRRRRTPP